MTITESYLLAQRNMLLHQLTHLLRNMQATDKTLVLRDGPRDFDAKEWERAAGTLRNLIESSKYYEEGGA